MKEPFDAILPELWEEIYHFLDDDNGLECDCSKFERVCLSFRELCIRMEKRKIREQLELESKYLKHPLFLSSSSSQGVREEDIQLVEERMGQKFPFHLREFIKIIDGRPAHSQDLTNLHYTNSLRPFKSWSLGLFGKVIIGGVFDDYEPTQIYINLEQGWMAMDISTYGTTDTIDGGWKGYLKMTSNMYESYNPFDMEKLSENFSDLVKISRYHSDILSCLPDKFKNDLELMKKLVVANPEAFGYMPEIIRDDINFIRELIMRRPRIYRSVSDRLKKDKELFDLACSLDITNFYHAHHSLKDKELALKYCKLSRYLSANDFPDELVDSELVHYFKHFWNVPEELRTPELAIHFLENNYDVKQEIKGDSNLQTPQVLEAIFRLCPAFLFNLKKEHLFTFDSKEVALKLFNGHQIDALKAFNVLPEHLKKDIDVIKAAIKKRFNIFKILSEELKQDRDFILYCWKESESTNFILDSDFSPYNQDLEFLEIACNNTPGLVFSLDRELVTEDFLNSLQRYFYKGSLVGDLLNMTRFEHYQNYKEKERDGFNENIYYGETD
ncbi:hypothetical protein NAEGRDRAFT_81322 [Naegleria gruberi]|uniref:DUF4116 domain-containing protein n=1 Tax=Naegleria gruberi TaxID=5762 RepID=D2VV07_NAEGR|nr:uncharacterized protein NAEGRDRAFT_81322 [Naegleria gruberi]EFC39357.1 hypothetical protein NAEGRDRAFT_81322 [Naegleria gruberi]|eukprot:XP_002672101.1 hypothetical protein NAEGRDRAFT_81322 [Naegleria gruberi strain NEG-M]